MLRHRRACLALAGADAGVFCVYEPVLRQFDQAGHDMGQDLIAAVRSAIPSGDAIGQCAERREAVQIADVDHEPDYPFYDTVRRAGYRALLAVPLLRRTRLVGALVLCRKRAGRLRRRDRRARTDARQPVGAGDQNARLFDDLERKGRELEAASRHKSEFLANMSHELRTPLNAVLGYAELIQDGIYGEVPQKIHDVLERIQQNGRHLLGLINDVLDLSKIEAGQLTLSPVDYSMRELVLDVVSATEALAAEKKLARGRRAEGSAPWPGRRAPPHPGAPEPRQQRHQVHRCGLGQDPGQGRGPQLRRGGDRHRRRHRGGGPRAHLRGVPASGQLEHAQEGRNGPRACHRQAHRRAPRRPHLGQIDPGQGSTFAFTLPLPIGVAGGSRMTKRILVVEDQDNRRIIRDLLTNAGYQLIEAADGEEGVRLAEAERPDLILMDIQLPVLDGYEATRRIKQNPELRHIDHRRHLVRLERR